jgi:redox-sensitive bicupin YhaK (pirin superfamily)
MIRVRRADERRRVHRRSHETWETFHASDAADEAEHFGALAMLTEARLRPATRHPRLYQETEVVTYVREGAVAYLDSGGRSGLIHAGEFQRLSVGRGSRHCETNASRTHTAQLFAIALRKPELGPEETDYEQRRFSVADRRGGLCVVASEDARRGSLRLHQDALIHSALLEPGQHVVHELARGRAAWLHIVLGEVGLGDDVLRSGDGAGIDGERAVSITAHETSEILLIDLAFGSGGGHGPRRE